MVLKNHEQVKRKTTDIENRLGVAKVEAVGEGRTGSLGSADAN